MEETLLEASYKLFLKERHDLEITDDVLNDPHKLNKLLKKIEMEKNFDILTNILSAAIMMLVAGSGNGTVAVIAAVCNSILVIAKSMYTTKQVNNIMKLQKKVASKIVTVDDKLKNTSSTDHKKQLENKEHYPKN